MKHSLCNHYINHSFPRCKTDIALGVVASADLWFSATASWPLPSGQRSIVTLTDVSVLMLSRQVEAVAWPENGSGIHCPTRQLCSWGRPHHRIRHGDFLTTHRRPVAVVVAHGLMSSSGRWPFFQGDHAGWEPRSLGALTSCPVAPAIRKCRATFSWGCFRVHQHSTKWANSCGTLWGTCGCLSVRLRINPGWVPDSNIQSSRWGGNAIIALWMVAGHSCLAFSPIISGHTHVTTLCRWYVRYDYYPFFITGPAS